MMSSSRFTDNIASVSYNREQFQKWADLSHDVREVINIFIKLCKIASRTF